MQGRRRVLNEQGCGGTFMGNMIMGPDQQRQFFLSFLRVPCGSPLSFLKMSTTIVFPTTLFFLFGFFPFLGFFPFSLFPQPRLQWCRATAEAFFPSCPLFFSFDSRKKVLEKRKRNCGLFKERCYWNMYKGKGREEWGLEKRKILRGNIKAEVAFSKNSRRI